MNKITCNEEQLDWVETLESKKAVTFASRKPNFIDTTFVCATTRKGKQHFSEKFASCAVSQEVKS